jgi:3-deoxy-D-manno-octulosonate 8-phosphate phosphatase (KDO 8-P phosphatase)
MKLAIFDVDGVLTDGRIYIGEQGETFKAFHALDGHGLKLLALGGIEPVVITGRDSPAVRRRVADLGLRMRTTACTTSCRGRGRARRAGRSAGPRRAAIGDDWPDLPLLRVPAFACAPANAHAEVKAVAHHVTARAAATARRASSATCC